MISSPAETPSAWVTTSTSGRARFTVATRARRRPFSRAWGGQQEFFGLTAPAHAPRNPLFYFRRRRPDRHGRTRRFTDRRRRIGAHQIGDPLEGGEHALVLVGRRRLLGRANLERRGGSRGGPGGAGEQPPHGADRGPPGGAGRRGTRRRVVRQGR